MLTPEQKERIAETFRATRVARKAIDRVDRKFRKAARAYINEALRGEPDVPAEKVPVFRGVLSPGELIGSRQPLPEKGMVKRYLLTCAQNNTVLHPDVWTNLLALKDYYGAELFIGRILYDRRVDRRNQKTWAADPHAELHSDEIAYTPEIEPYVLDSPTELAPGLRWCGELNVHATANLPLSGLEGYGKDGSIIVPHPRIAMESFPRMGKREEPRFGYTTGAVTAINYIPRKAGQKAAFAHCYGALIVEVNSDGEWWVRQVQADQDGVLCDLNITVVNGIVTELPGENVEAIVWGDLHLEVGDDKVIECNWDCVVPTLKPRHQVFHDVLDFRARNHHERDNPMASYMKWLTSRDSVEEECHDLAAWLAFVAGSPGAGKVHVVDSNHDRALTRWLDEANFRDDPVNAEFFLKWNLYRYQTLGAGGCLLDAVLNDVVEHKLDDLGVEFLGSDESLVLLDVEHGLHGDRGVDGRRGNANAYAKMESKVTVGHTHSARIYAGVYVVGTTSKLRLGYTKGPSTWSHTFCLLYSNGQRTLVTVRDGRPWA